MIICGFITYYFSITLKMVAHEKYRNLHFDFHMCNFKLKINKWKEYMSLGLLNIPF